MYLSLSCLSLSGGPNQASVLFTSTDGGDHYTSSTDFTCGLPALGKSCGEQSWVELTNGTILALIRSNEHNKMAALSTSAGHSWFGHRIVPELTEPSGGVEGSLIRAPDGRLLFMGAASDAALPPCKSGGNCRRTVSVSSGPFARWLQLLPLH